MITEQGKKMLELLAATLHGRTPKPIPTKDWPAVFDELKAQTVYALPAENISDLGLTPSEKQAYLNAVAQNIRTFYALMEAQQTVLEILRSKNIPVVVLKGAAAAMNYPHPEYRCMGDVDIIVRLEDFKEAYSVLVSAGYQTVESLDDYAKHIGFLSSDNISIELHDSFATNRLHTKRSALDDAISAAIPQAEYVEVCGYLTPVLPPLENGLVLLSHIFSHLDFGLGFRQIIDWMYYVENHLDDTFWETVFCARAQSLGMRTLAETVTLLCKQYLGLSNITWCDQADQALVDELLYYLLGKGNFGHKKYQSNASVSAMRNIRNPLLAFQYLHVAGMLHWKAARQYKLLVPFAWIYQIGHLIRMGLMRREGIQTLVSEFQKSKEESALVDKLKQ